MARSILQDLRRDTRLSACVNAVGISPASSNSPDDQSWNQLEPGALDCDSGNLETAAMRAIGKPHCGMREDGIMSNDDPPFVYEGLDPVPEQKSTIADVSDAVKGTAHRIGNAIDAGKKPGMPLSILSNIAREAPLGSLLVAFLLGIAVARRR
jgi:hypothetical protein